MSSNSAFDLLLSVVFSFLWLTPLSSVAAELPVPEGFSQPAALDQLEWSPELAELGRHLFYDVRLSRNATVSCASCHQQHLAFSDGRRTSVGATGEVGKRNAMPLINLAYRDSLGWSDQHGFIDQLDRPLFGKSPVEMAASEQPIAIQQNTSYQRQFQRVFGSADTVTWPNIKKALVAFEITLISGNSIYDQWVFQDRKPKDDIVKGMQLFFSAELGCGNCHGGTGFNNEFFIRGTRTQSQLQSNGLISAQKKFRIPTLRNIEHTAPYMHDGRLSTLTSVIGFYASGPNPEAGLKGFNLTPAQTGQLMAFLRGLSDEEFLNNPAFQNPWKP